MPTKLEKTIRRELEIDGKAYTVVIAPEGIKITPKGGRKGRELSWASMLNEDTASSPGSTTPSNTPSHAPQY
jgi:hypothetical protein